MIEQCASPPCFADEVDPSYFGFMDQDEIAALLGELMALDWPGTPLEAAWIHAMLRRHGAPDQAAPARPDLAALRGRIAAALPRVHQDCLRDDLAQLLFMLGRGDRQPARHA